MELFYREFGDGNRNLIIIHGLYGASDNWVTIAKLLKDNFHVYLIDQRNHGQSPHSDDMNYEFMSDDLNEFMEQHDLDEAIIMGHSMGGKAAMRFALAHPQKVTKLFILDIAPKSYGSYSNYAEITNDHRTIIDALLNVNLNIHASRQSVDKELQDAIPNKMVRSFLLKNLGRDEDKQLYWKFNLQVLSDHLQDIMDGFSDIKGKVSFPEDKPVFLVRGEDSPYVHEDDMQEVRTFFPSVQTANIPNAGHWLHAEQPELFLKTVLYFMG